MTTVKIIVAALLNYLWNNVVTHIPIRLLRLLFLRIANGKISSSAVILMHTRILNFWNIEIGEHAVVNQYVLLDCRKNKVIIHHDADIGPYTRIWTTGHDPESLTHEITSADVIISHHAWIASDVTILPGVVIGEGAVVAASSVVTKSIPASEIWAGVPASFVRKRVNPLTYSLKFNPYFE